MNPFVFYKPSTYHTETTATANIHFHFHYLFVLFFVLFYTYNKFFFYQSVTYDEATALTSPCSFMLLPENIHTTKNKQNTHHTVYILHCVVHLIAMIIWGCFGQIHSSKRGALWKCDCFICTLVAEPKLCNIHIQRYYTERGIKK